MLQVVRIVQAVCSWQEPALDAEHGGGCPYDSWDDFVAAYQGARHLNMKEVFPDDWGSYRRYEIGQAYRKAPHQQPTKLTSTFPASPRRP